VDKEALFTDNANPRHSTSSLGPVRHPVKPSWLRIWAFVGVPLIFFLFISLSYRIALAHGRLPFLPSGGSRWLLVYFTSLASGALAIAFPPKSRLWFQVALALAYFVMMAIFLFGEGLVIACSNGDCI
jgi:hypothetical protein